MIKLVYAPAGTPFVCVRVLFPTKKQRQGWCWSWKCLCSIDDTSIFLLSTTGQSSRQPTSSANARHNRWVFRLSIACVWYVEMLVALLTEKGKMRLFFFSLTLYACFPWGLFPILTRSLPGIMCVYVCRWFGCSSIDTLSWLYIWFTYTSFHTKRAMN